MKTRRLTTATGVALGALLAVSCTYDRAPDRATTTTWDTRDDAGEPMDERQASINDITSPFVGAAEPASGGGPGSDVGGEPGERSVEQRRFEERVSERVDPTTGERVVVIEDAERVEVRVDGSQRVMTRSTAESSTEPETTAAAEEAPRTLGVEQPGPGEAPLLDEASPEEPAVAEPALRAIADEPTPAAPLMAGGVLRDESCPMELEGAQVGLVERAEGPALIFRMDEPGDVEELQSRVMALALTRDDERVEVPAGDTSAALAEEPGPIVEPPEATDMQEGAAGEMPFNLPSELSTGERGAASEGDIATRLEPLPEAEVTVELSDEGAEMLFEPFDEDQRAALTQQLEGRASALSEGECPADTMSMLTTPTDTD